MKGDTGMCEIGDDDHSTQRCIVAGPRGVVSSSVIRWLDDICGDGRRRSKNPASYLAASGMFSPGYRGAVDTRHSKVCLKRLYQAGPGRVLDDLALL